MGMKIAFKAFKLDCVSETKLLETQSGAFFTPRLIHVNHFLLFRMCVQSDCMRNEFAY